MMGKYELKCKAYETNIYTLISKLKEKAKNENDLSYIIALESLRTILKETNHLTDHEIIESEIIFERLE